MVTKQPHGKVSYSITIDVKDNKYRYFFTDFVFQFYTRDRYGNYVPQSGKYKALEEEKFAGMQKTWDQHKVTIKKRIEQQIELLKITMVKKEVVEEKTIEPAVIKEEKKKVEW